MRLPKTVILENERLLIVYNATMYLLVGLVLVAFIWNKSWSVVLDASDSLGFSLWVGNFTEIGQIASHINDELPPLCKSTSRYNFWLHRVGETVKYDDFHCAPMCSRADMNEGCIRLDQLMQVQQDSVFFATGAETSRWTPSESGHDEVENQYMLFPFEEYFSFGMDYSFVMKSSERLAASKGFLRPFEKNNFASGSSNSNIITVILKQSKEVHRVVHPAQGVFFSLSELFELADLKGSHETLSSSLDKEQVELGPNIYASQNSSSSSSSSNSSSGPTRRLTGLQLTLFLNCYTPDMVPARYQVQKDTPICTLHPVTSPPMWVGLTDTRVRDGTVRVRLHGIVVHVVTNMRVRRFDLSVLFAFVANAVVYLSLPKAFFGVILVNCMGHMTHIYKNVLQEKFTLSKHMCALVIDVLTKNVVFSMLAERQEGLSYKNVARTMIQTLHCADHVQESHVEALALFGLAYATAGRGFKNHRHESESKTLDWLKSARLKEFDLKSFVMASTSDREVTMNELLSVMMGDQESKHWLAEVFVPWGLRSLYKLSRMLDAEENPQSMTVSPYICDCNGVSASKQKEDHYQDEDEDKDKHAGTFCDQIPSKADDRLMELEDHVKQLQATVEQYQLTFESRMQSWSCQIEQDLLQNLQDNYNTKFQALESRMQSWSLQLEQDAHQKVQDNRRSNKSSSLNHNDSHNHSNNNGESKNRITTSQTASASQGSGPNEGVPHIASRAQVIGKQDLPNTSSGSVELWVDALHEWKDTHQVNRVIGDCLHNLRLIADSSARSAMKQASGIQYVSKRFDQMKTAVSSHSDVSTRERIEMMQSIVRDSAVSVKEHTSNILDICFRLDSIAQENSSLLDSLAQENSSLRDSLSKATARSLVSKTASEGSSVSCAGPTEAKRDTVLRGSS